jgi:ribosomal protein L29
VRVLSVEELNELRAEMLESYHQMRVALRSAKECKSAGPNEGQ